jgi:hypothetical protein
MYFLSRKKPQHGALLQLNNKMATSLFLNIVQGVFQHTDAEP